MRISYNTRNLIIEYLFVTHKEISFLGLRVKINSNNSLLTYLLQKKLQWSFLQKRRITREWMHLLQQSFYERNLFSEKPRCSYIFYTILMFPLTHRYYLS